MPFGILFLYGFLYFHKEIDGGCNHQQAKKRIEQTRTFTSHVADNVSGIWDLKNQSQLNVDAKMASRPTTAKIPCMK